MFFNLNVMSSYDDNFYYRTFPEKNIPIVSGSRPHFRKSCSATI